MLESFHYSSTQSDAPMRTPIHPTKCFYLAGIDVVASKPVIDAVQDNLEVCVCRRSRSNILAPETVVRNFKALLVQWFPLAYIS